MPLLTFRACRRQHKSHALHLFLIGLVKLIRQGSLSAEIDQAKALLVAGDVKRAVRQVPIEVAHIVVPDRMSACHKLQPEG